MGKYYAYCPNGAVLFIEKRTETYTDPYPIQWFYTSGLLPYFKEIPQQQKEVVRPLWVWNAQTGLFQEPEIGEEVNGEIYIGTLPKSQVWDMMQDNVRLQAAMDAMEQDNAALLLENARQAVTNQKNQNDIAGNEQMVAVLMLEVAKKEG